LTIVVAKNKTYNGKNKYIQLRHNLIKQLLKSNNSIEYVNLKMKSNRFFDKTCRYKLDFRSIKENKTQATCKQTSDGNLTFVIEDSINKLHMDKNESLDSFARTKINLKSTLSIPMVCQSARYHIIKRINFIVKFYVVYKILTLNKISYDFHISYK